MPLRVGNRVAQWHDPDSCARAKRGGGGGTQPHRSAEHGRIDVPRVGAVVWRGGALKDRRTSKGNAGLRGTLHAGTGCVLA
jgi:hypothetical protein